ncbi:MAG: hypothetical protein RL685_3096 [Pseudomonadota bacterium]
MGAASWAAAATGAAAWLLGAFACLPSEDLSGYSSGSRRIEPGIALDEALPNLAEVGTPAGEQPPFTGASSPSAAPLASSECNGECTEPELPLLSDAGPLDPADESQGTVAPNDLPVSESDAGAVPASGDAAAAVGPCGQGALLAPDDRCVALITAPSAWDAARAACVARGAGWDLAVIRGVERNNWLAGMLDGVADAWVGANDLAQEGSWRWVGDTSAFFTGTGTAGSAAAGAYVRWNTGGTPEPNGGAASDCLRLRASGGWADIPCTTAFAALCEGPQP